MTRLIVEIEKIKGNCVVFKGNERIVIEGAEIKLEETDKICIHALQSILHYAVALREGVDPRKLGLAKEGDVAYVQCLDPGEPYTSGGTVVFRIRRVDK